MKKSIKKIVLLIIITISIIALFTKSVEAITSEEYRQKEQESLAYAMSLIDDNMCEREKAVVLQQWVNEGSIYGFGPNHQTSKGMLVDHMAVCAGHMQAYKLLMNTAGLPCEAVTSKRANHGWSLVYLEGIWNYMDTTKVSGRMYQDTYGRGFYTQDKFDFIYQGESYYFSDAVVSQGFSIPKTKEYGNKVKATYRSRVYYDENYKYYTDYETNNQLTVVDSFICKENRKTGEIKKLTQDVQLFYGRLGDSNIVKEGNYIYYVNKDNKTIWKTDINGNNKTKVYEAPTNTAIVGVFVQEGKIMYTFVPDAVNNPTNCEKRTLKDFENWVTTGEYTLNNQSQQYILKYIKSKKGITITKCEGIDGNEPTGQIYIPDTINGLPVIGIGEDAFSGAQKLTGTLNLPNSLEYICEYAFSSTGITGINFNNKLKSIGKYAFSACREINVSITLPNSLTYVDNNAFELCENMTNINFGTGLRYLSNNLFYKCKNLQEIIEVPEGVSKVPFYTFLGCDNTKSIALPTTVDDVGMSKCDELWIKSSNVTAMNFSSNCKNNTVIYLPAGTKTAETAEKLGIKYIDSTNLSFNTAKLSIDNLSSDTKDIDTLELEPDDEVLLKSHMKPNFWKVYPVNWSSSNSNIVSIDSNGNVRAIKEGTATIYVRYNGKEKAITCKVENRNKIKFEEKKTIIDKDTVKTLNIVSGVSSLSNLTWKIKSAITGTEYDITDSYISKYIKVEVLNNSQVKITPIDSESVRINGVYKYNNEYSLIVNDSNGYRGQCDIMVRIPIEVIRIKNGNRLSMTWDGLKGAMDLDYKDTSNRNLKLELQAWVPSEATIMGEPVWHIENEEVLTYRGKDENGYYSFTVHQGGTTRITAEVDGVTGILDLNVTGDVPIENIAFEQSYVKIKHGEKIKYTPVITPSNTTHDTSIKWTSSNTNIATVDSSGTVTGIGNGVTTITAYIENYAVSYTVEVREKYFVDKIITKKVDTIFDLDLDLGEKFDGAELETGEVIKVNWTSNNESVVSVMSNGTRYYGRRGGFATLTATDERYGTATYLIFVDEPISIEYNDKRYAGDLNGDYIYDQKDIDLLVDIIEREDFASKLAKLADINGDGVINNLDKDLLQDIVTNNSIKLDVHIYATSVKVIPETKEVNLVNGRASAEFDYVIYPENSENRIKEWELNREITTESGSIITNIQTMNYIQVTEPGTYDVVAITDNYIRSNTVKLIVKAPIESITLNKKQITLEQGDTENLLATILPSNTTDSKNITWTSNNGAVASVNSNGIVTGIGKGTSIITAKTSNGKTATCTVTVNGEEVIDPPTPPIQEGTHILYRTHVQNVGLQDYVQDGEMAGTNGLGLRLEGIRIKLESDIEGNVEYRAHVQNIGWEEYRKNDELSGTAGRNLRLEAIQIRLTGEISNYYDVYYRVHAQNVGWLDWAKNGEESGTEGYGFRLEGIEIKLVEKGNPAPGKTTKCFKENVKVEYTTHVQNVGWQEYVKNGQMAGTSGQSLRLEGIKIRVKSRYSGDIEYSTHIQNIGWQIPYAKNDSLSGTSGQSLRLEAIKINLTGELAEKYDVYYRVHAEVFGWLDWAKNGEESGTAGYGYRLEGIEIRLVDKGESAPGVTDKPFVSK